MAGFNWDDAEDPFHGTEDAMMFLEEHDNASLPIVDVIETVDAELHYALSFDNDVDAAFDDEEDLSTCEEPSGAATGENTSASKKRFRKTIDLG